MRLGNWKRTALVALMALVTTLGIVGGPMADTALAKPKPKYPTYCQKHLGAEMILLGDVDQGQVDPNKTYWVCQGTTPDGLPFYYWYLA